MLSNMANDVNLTDMETCYKMVRADVLRQLRLQSDTFTLEPEITCRLAQWGARIYEVPISYSGRTYLEGKKIKAIDGVKVFLGAVSLPLPRPAILRRSRVLLAQGHCPARNFNRWLLQQCGDCVGQRILELGAGIGGLSALLLAARAWSWSIATPSASPGCKASSACAQPARDSRGRNRSQRRFRLERRTDRHRPLPRRPRMRGRRRGIAAGDV